MKKLITACLCLLLTLAVTAAGFLLPSAMSAYQDRQTFSKIEHMSMEPLELTYSSSLYDTLRLLSKGHYYVDYPLTGSSRSANEIYEIVLDIIRQFEDNGILVSDSEFTVTNHTITLQLAIASDSNIYTELYGIADGKLSGGESVSSTEASGDSSSNITTAVVWACSVYFVSGYWMNFWIDDKSGKAVAFSMYTEQTLILTDSGSTQDLDSFAGKIADFLQDYYELPSESRLKSLLESSTLFEKAPAALEANYVIELKEDSGKAIQMPLHIRPEYMMLN